MPSPSRDSVSHAIAAPENRCHQQQQPAFPTALLLGLFRSSRHPSSRLPRPRPNAKWQMQMQIAIQISLILPSLRLVLCSCYFRRTRGRLMHLSSLSAGRKNKHRRPDSRAAPRHHSPSFTPHGTLCHVHAQRHHFQLKECRRKLTLCRPRNGTRH